MTLKSIRLELARDKQHPGGDANHGYVFRAPLDPSGLMDRFQWAVQKSFCTVKRIENGDVVESGLLVLNRHGKWVFSYAPGTEDDETLFRLTDHRFVPNEYVSVTEHDGVQRTFKVVAISDWHPDEAAAAKIS